MSTVRVSRFFFLYTFSEHRFGFVFQRPRTPSLDEIFEKIREAVHKNGIRTTEFFKDHDKLRSGEITENQARIN